MYSKLYPYLEVSNIIPTFALRFVKQTPVHKNSVCGI